MGVRKRAQIGNVGTIGHEIKNDKVCQPQEGDQGQVCGPQVPFLGHWMTKRPRIGHNWTSGQEMANNKICQHLQGGQGQVAGPQVPLLSHENEIKSPNWAWLDYRTWHWKWWGHSTSGRWPGPSRWTTGASSSPRGWQRDPRLGMMAHNMALGLQCH